MKKVEVNSVKRDVYHNNPNCTERNNIEKENLKIGDGGKRLCLNCKRLNKKK